MENIRDREAMEIYRKITRPRPNGYHNEGEGWEGKESDVIRYSTDFAQFYDLGSHIDYSISANGSVITFGVITEDAGKSIFKLHIDGKSGETITKKDILKIICRDETFSFKN